MKYNLIVDTIALQVDYHNEYKCDLGYSQLQELLKGYGYFYDTIKKEYQYKHKKILTMSKGSYGVKRNGNKQIIYYIRIKLAGLKRYLLYIDIASHNALMIIASYFNTNKQFYKVTQFDVAVDIFTKYKNILVLCTNKRPSTKYFGANEEQPFNTTTYIEKFNNGKDKANAAVHMQKYCKTSKSKLLINITRVEISFQKPFLNKNGLNIGYMYAEIMRYHILYIANNMKKQQEVKDKYDSIEIMRARDIKSLNISQHRLHIDIIPLASIISDIYTVTDDVLVHYLKKNNFFTTY